MTRFSPTPADVAALVREQPLALVISDGAPGFATTPLPLLATTSSSGEIVEFFGHFARANPQVAMVEANPRALVLFQGPHAYIPPAAVSDPGWAPTWNYAVAQFEVEIHLAPIENERSIDELVDAMEGDRWSPARLGNRYRSMLNHIVAFRATVIAATAKFKLGQDEKSDSFEQIVEWLGDQPLARMMRRSRSNP